MKILRVVCQLLFLAFFLLLMIWTIKPVASPVRVNFFMCVDPLLAVSAALAGPSWKMFARFLPGAVVMLVLALVLGRAFCGWACPLGTTFDISDRIFTGFARKRNRKAPTKFKFLLLVVLLMFSLLGLEITGWFDPMCIATRTCTTTGHPAFDYLGKKLLIRMAKVKRLKSSAASAYSGLIKTNILMEPSYKVKPPDNLIYPSRYKYTSDLDEIHRRTSAYFIAYRWAIAYGLLFAVLLALQLVSSRFWCRAACPLGALLGLAGARRFLGPVINDKCIDCGKCETACGVGAIVKSTDNKRVILNTECTLCMNCFKVCSSDAVKWGWPAKAPVKNSAVPSRRAFIAGALTAIVARPVFGLNIRKARSSGNLIRPPGAGVGKAKEEEFLDRCIRCGECMKVCPKKAIQPAGMENGLEGLWTPVIVPEMGYCRYECVPNDVDTEAGNYCGLVCPTGAIKILTRKEKKSTCIGTARVQRNSCITYSMGYKCGICAGICPVGAIKMVPSTQYRGAGIRHPYVNVNKCIGCGACEYICPVKGDKGIRVKRLLFVPQPPQRDEFPKPRRRRKRGEK